jgi:hypothetical protein
MVKRRIIHCGRACSSSKHLTLNRILLLDSGHRLFSRHADEILYMPPTRLLSSLVARRDSRSALNSTAGANSRLFGLSIQGRYRLEVRAKVHTRAMKQPPRIVKIRPQVWSLVQLTHVEVHVDADVGVEMHTMFLVGMADTFQITLSDEVDLEVREAGYRGKLGRPRLSRIVSCLHNICCYFRRV